MTIRGAVDDGVEARTATPRSSSAQTSSSSRDKRPCPPLAAGQDAASSSALSCCRVSRFRPAPGVSNGRKPTRSGVAPSQTNDASGVRARLELSAVKKWRPRLACHECTAPSSRPVIRDGSQGSAALPRATPNSSWRPSAPSTARQQAFESHAASKPRISGLLRLAVVRRRSSARRRFTGIISRHAPPGCVRASAAAMRAVGESTRPRTWRSSCTKPGAAPGDGDPAGDAQSGLKAGRARRCGDVASTLQSSMSTRDPSSTSPRKARNSSCAKYSRPAASISACAQRSTRPDPSQRSNSRGGPSSIASLRRSAGCWSENGTASSTTVTRGDRPSSHQQRPRACRRAPGLAAAARASACVNSSTEGRRARAIVSWIANGGSSGSMAR